MPGSLPALLHGYHLGILPSYAEGFRRGPDAAESTQGRKENLSGADGLSMEPAEIPAQGIHPQHRAL